MIQSVRVPAFIQCPVRPGVDAEWLTSRLSGKTAVSGRYTSFPPGSPVSVLASPVIVNLGVQFAYSGEDETIVTAMVFWAHGYGCDCANRVPLFTSSGRIFIGFSSSTLS